MRIVAAAVLGIGLLGAAHLQHERPLLVWNASASVPVGFYIMSTRQGRIGDYVLASLSPVMRRLAERRGYKGRNAPLLKRIAAMEAQTVCRFGRLVTIRGRPFVVALDADPVGRPMPVWRGCRRLRGGQVFLLGSDPGSFDSRYFGPLHARQVIGTAIPIWQIR